MEISEIRLLRDDVSIWLVYAGRGRRYFDFFREQKAVFLTLPGFDASDQVFATEELIRQHLSMADNIGRWVTGGLNAPPIRRSSAYLAYPHSAGSTEAKSFSSDVGNINRLFNQAKTGDLVLSPPHGHYDPYLIGEITHPWRKADDLAVPMLKDEIVPTRRVRWLDTALARRDFLPKVSRRLQNQHAITYIDDSLYENIFNRVYSSYVWKSRSKLDVYGDDYSGTDPLQTYPSAILIKYVLASAFAFEKGEFDAFQSMDPSVAINAYYDESLVEEFGQNFNSPGRFAIIAAIASASIFAAAGLHIAIADPQVGFSHAQAAALHDVKQAIQGDNKAPRVAELDNYVQSMKAVNWKEVQKKLGAPAKATMKLSLSNKVQVAKHRAELDDR